MVTTEEKSQSRRQFIRALSQGAGLGVLLSLAFGAGYFFKDYSPLRQTSEISLDLINEVDGILSEHYLYDLPSESVQIHGAAAGLVSSLAEPYTYFVDPEEAEIDSTNLAGRFGGIGAELGRDEAGNFVIVRVYADNPAAKAGVQDGDIILEVDGVPVDTTAPDMSDVLAAIRGEIGDSLVLTVRRGEDILTFDIVRAEILIPSTLWELVKDDPQIGYIRITRFTERSPEEVAQALDELSQQNARAFIIDLRDNGGGLVDSAVGVAEQFLDGGVVLYEERSDAQDRVFNAARGGKALDVPLVVLINEHTASASEIVAGAFQDRGRAILIGRQSFGKGSVQRIFTLSDGSSLHVTNAQWFTPNHNRIEQQGLTPDIVTELTEGTDSDMAAAVNYLDDILSASSGEVIHSKPF
jgi:carboxyl-terminal processing protease